MHIPIHIPRIDAFIQLMKIINPNKMQLQAFYGRF